MIPFYMIWKNEAGDRLFRDWDYSAGAFVNTDLAYGVLHPKDTSEIQTVILQNPARLRRIQMEQDFGRIRTPLERVVDIKLFLDGEEDTLRLLLDEWPALGSGLEMSMDHGISWNLFSRTYGNPGDSATWPILSAVCINEGAVDGELSPYPPFDRASIQLRLKVPEGGLALGSMLFHLEVSSTVL